MEQLPALSEFPDKETALVYYLGIGIPQKEAAKLSGLDKIPPGFLSRADVSRALESQWRAHLKADLSRCRAILMTFVEDEDAPRAIRVKAAATLFTWLGKDSAISGSDKPLSEMTGDELRAATEKLQRELGARASAAKVIDAPSKASAKPTPIDILG